MTDFLLPGIKDKVAIITGASSPIGAATCELFRLQGAKVYPFDLPQHDLTHPELIPHYVHPVALKEGRIDILVNNAAITPLGNIMELEPDEMDRAIAVNLKAPLLLMKAVIPHMVKAGGGSIVNNTSDQALVGKRFCTLYGATKAALAQVTMSAALDWAEHKIRVNAIAPGSVDTQTRQVLLRELRERYPKAFPGDYEASALSAVPLKRLAQPKEIAYAIAFLASDAASFITGTILPVDGGFVAQ